jgi:hypothetical protein
MNDAGTSLCKLRLAVAFLGQRSEQHWWDTEFLSGMGLQLLAYNFPRHPLVAGFTSTCQAAKRVHDDRIGRRATYHLFRLPAERESEVHRIAAEDGGRWLAEMPLDRDGAMEVLRQVAVETVDAPEGPVQVGEFRDIHTIRGVEELAKHYLSAFERGVMTLPYFAVQSK